MYIFIIAEMIRSRRIFAISYFVGAVSSGWLSAHETQLFTPADEEYIKEYCRGDDYDHWIRLSINEDITAHLKEAGFVERQPVSSTSPAHKRRKRSVIPQPYVYPGHLSDWVGEKAYFWCFFEDNDYFRYQPYTIEWFHNGKRFCPGGNPSISGFSLDIDPVTPESNGFYECAYRGVRSKTKAEFMVKQNIKAEASHVTAGLGEPATMSCKVIEGMPTPKISWYRVNSPDQSNFDPGDIFLYEHKEGLNPDDQYASGNDINFSINGEFLEFHAVEEKDYGIIRCRILSKVSIKIIYSELLRPGVLIVFPYPDGSYTINKPLSGMNTNTGLCAIRDVDNQDDTPPEIIADEAQVQVNGLGGRLKLFGFDKAKHYRAFKGFDGGIVENTGLVSAELAASENNSDDMGSENSGFYYNDTCPGDYIPPEAPSIPMNIATEGNDAPYEILNAPDIPSYEILPASDASDEATPGHSGAKSTIANLSLLLSYTLLGLLMK